MNIDDDPKAAFATPMRASLRQWLKVEAARRGVRIQDLMEDIVTRAKSAGDAEGGR